jgi:hypothetical protein
MSIGTIQGHHITTLHATKHPKFYGQNVHTTSAVEHPNQYLNAYNKRLGVSCLGQDRFSVVGRCRWGRHPCRQSRTW